MNIISGVCVFLLCIFVSKFAAEKHVKRATFYRDMYNFNKLLQSEVLFAKTSILSIVNNLSYKTDFELMLKEYFNCRIIKTNFYYLEPNERKFVENYLLSLGVGDEETQLNSIQSIAEQIADKQKRYDAESKKISGLSVKLGFLTGVTGLIIFL